MKKAKLIGIIILGSFFGILFLIATINLALNYWGAIEKSKVPEMTLERAQRLFEEVGGTEAINREANVLFTRCIMEERNRQILYPEDLRDTPSIALLFSKLENYSGFEYSGTSLTFYRNGGRHYFEIKFGNHYVLRFIYIFDTDSETTVNSSQPGIIGPSQSWIKAAPNIFIEN